MYAIRSYYEDPVPKADYAMIDERDVKLLKQKILESGMPKERFIAAAWGSASTFRGSDKRGGANGARIRLLPQKDWEVNEPEHLGEVIKTLETIRTEFHASQTGTSYNFV